LGSGGLAPGTAPETVAPPRHLTPAGQGRRPPHQLAQHLRIALDVAPRPFTSARTCSRICVLGATLLMQREFLPARQGSEVLLRPETPGGNLTPVDCAERLGHHLPVHDPRRNDAGSATSVPKKAKKCRAHLRTIGNKGRSNRSACSRSSWPRFLC